MSEYCLRWNNHRPNLVTVFSELLTSEALVDVTLATDGHYIHAHKLVLSACSVYFKDLFGANPCKHPIVILKDIRIDDLKTVIDFIYRGEVNVAQDRLQDVLRTAESLRIKGLAENPRSYDEMSSHSARFMGSQQTSRQRSSMTDSREQSLSVEGEEEGEAVTPPPNKKRKITSSHDSSESVQEEGEGEERGGGGREVKDEPPDETEEGRPSREGSEQDVASMGGSQEALVGEDSTTTTTTTTTTPGTSTTDPALPAHAQGSVCRWGTEGPSLENLLGSPYTPPGPPTPASSPPHAALPSSPISPSSLLQYPMHPPPPAYFPHKGWSPQFRRMSPNMLMAIEAVRSGKMGFTQAGKTFSVNGRTLWVYYRKLGYEVHNTFRGRRNKAPQHLPQPQQVDGSQETLPSSTPSVIPTQPCPGSSQQHSQPQHHSLDSTHAILDTGGQNGPGATTGNATGATTAAQNGAGVESMPAMKEEANVTLPHGPLGDSGLGEPALEQYGYLPPPPPHHHHLHHTPDITSEDLQTEDASRALQSLLESYNFRSMWTNPT